MSFFLRKNSCLVTSEKTRAENKETHVIFSYF